MEHYTNDVRTLKWCLWILWLLFLQHKYIILNNSPNVVSGTCVLSTICVFLQCVSIYVMPAVLLLCRHFEIWNSAQKLWLCLTLSLNYYWKYWELFANVICENNWSVRCRVLDSVSYLWYPLVNGQCRMPAWKSNN